MKKIFKKIKKNFAPIICKQELKRRLIFELVLNVEQTNFFSVQSSDKYPLIQKSFLPIIKDCSSAERTSQTFLKPIYEALFVKQMTTRQMVALFLNFIFNQTNRTQLLSSHCVVDVFVQVFENFLHFFNVILLINSKDDTQNNGKNAENSKVNVYLIINMNISQNSNVSIKQILVRKIYLASGYSRQVNFCSSKDAKISQIKKYSPVNFLQSITALKNTEKKKHKECEYVFQGEDVESKFKLEFGFYSVELKHKEGCTQKNQELHNSNYPFIHFFIQSIRRNEWGKKHEQTVIIKMIYINKKMISKFQRIFIQNILLTTEYFRPEGLKRSYLQENLAKIKDLKKNSYFLHCKLFLYIKNTYLIFLTYQKACFQTIYFRKSTCNNKTEGKITKKMDNQAF